ncbi:probable WRKY transcription factor 29 [Tanacetum coccineum]|uniref:Probable WRKY transcription factor 29 n=1 Tax=Tanacetum coccineum TaxID=301880 RepID=A0ABQ5BNH1_9ASTR
MADHWGLQALLRPNEYEQHQDHHHVHDDGFGSIDIKQEYDQALLFCYPHLFDNNSHDAATTSSVERVGARDDELNHLYKPFYNPVYDHENEFFRRPTLAENDLKTTIQHQDFDQQVQQDKNIKNFGGSSSNISQVAPKLKKRKNQQKKVVVQVTADGLSSDPWAWRKYGQKPIKGSIYPRSYYRCSSSKACMARRQVEQSCKDSSVYILTYTADHNHPQPTRRNSLAGINRNRFKATPKSPTLSDEVSKAVTKLKDSPFNSPTTPASASSMDDEVLQQPNIKQETTFYNKYDDQGHTMMSGFHDDELMLFSDDFFEGLEDLVGYKTETSSSSQISSNKQFPRVFS